jgi:hypothetical protein
MAHNHLEMNEKNRMIEPVYVLKYAKVDQIPTVTT